ncbi:MAG TPA: topoisomerase DNA-binding C4 zinc finger domain-containing protein [Opitutaceae bacterium]|nr:topoisomerase DNA-binding C4 zinc finger domain-containing protein [Opitutaceae bacterium]
MQTHASGAAGTTVTSPAATRNPGDVSSDHPKRLRPNGGYRYSRSFATTTLICDGTLTFCDRFVDRSSRMIDQMLQAAQSGRQNIAEAYRASGAASQIELRLANLARARLDELLLDYEDFLRERKLLQWSKDTPEALTVRRLARTLTDERSTAAQGNPPPDLSAATPAATRATYAPWLDHRDPAVVANTLICLIHQANFFLNQQISALEQDAAGGPGNTERGAAAATTTPQPKAPDPAAPACPKCGRPMKLRTAHKGANAGGQFWGCTGYPACTATVRLAGAGASKARGAGEPGPLQPPPSRSLPAA